MHRVGFGAKLTGYKEELKGKLTRNPELAQRGHDRVTGELKAKQQAEEDANNPFTKKEGEEGAGDESTPAPPNAPNAASAEKIAPQ
ncbi:hypothetical protein FRC08_001623 [Ceratobasidium sp. 394]|nr:hypothetical protein FRC08_001623 [Ceratobasidium sp. 394]